MMSPRRIAQRTLAFGLVACVMQATRADASVIVIGSRTWERLQKLSVSAAPVEAETKPLHADADRPWRQGPSLGSGISCLPVVPSRRDDGPATSGDRPRIDHRHAVRQTERNRVRVPPPVPAGVYRPPKAAPAIANVT